MNLMRGVFSGPCGCVPIPGVSAWQAAGAAERVLRPRQGRLTTQDTRRPLLGYIFMYQLLRYGYVFRLTPDGLRLSRLETPHPLQKKEEFLRL